LLRRRQRLSLLWLWQRIRRRVPGVRSVRKQQPIQSCRVATTAVTGWLLQWIHRWSPWAADSSRNPGLRASTRRRRLNGLFRSRRLLKSHNNLSVDWPAVSQGLEGSGPPVALFCNVREGQFRPIIARDVATEVA